MKSGLLALGGPYSVGKTGTGKIAFTSAGFEREDCGALSRVSRSALFLDGDGVHPDVKRITYDTIVYTDSSGNRLSCSRISSISIGLTNNSNFDLFGFCSDEKMKSTTIRCAVLPQQCPPDSGGMLVQEIENAIFRCYFTIKDDSGIPNGAIFRTRADCERYARSWAKKK